MIIIMKALIRSHNLLSFIISLINLLMITSQEGLTFSLHTVSSNELLQLRKLFTETISGGSNTLNYYYTHLYIGQSSQKQSYIIDTGSHITTSPCYPYCNDCGKHQHKYYRPSEIENPLDCADPRCNLVHSTCDERFKCSFSIV